MSIPENETTFKDVVAKGVRYTVTINYMGRFTAYREGERAASSESFEGLTKRLEQMERAQQRVKIAVPFAEVRRQAGGIYGNPLPTAHQVEVILVQKVITGQHATTGQWLVYDESSTDRNKTGQVSSYSLREVLRPDITDDDLNQLRKLYGYQDKVNRLLKEWRMKHTFNADMEARQQLKDAQSMTTTLDPTNIENPDLPTL